MAFVLFDPGIIAGYVRRRFQVFDIKHLYKSQEKAQKGSKYFIAHDP